MDWLLRPVNPNDLDAITRLNRLAFALTRSDAEVAQTWFPEGVVLPGRTRWAVVHPKRSTLVATYAELDLQICCLGQVLPAIGLSGVAVAPEWRGQGIAHWMLEESLGRAQRQKIPLMMLYPFQHGFYRRLGWAWVGQLWQYAIATVHLPQQSPRDSSASLTTQLGSIHPLREQDWAAIKQTYQQVALQKQGWLQRADWQWEQHRQTYHPLQAAGKAGWCYWQGDRLLGYLFVAFQERSDYGGQIVAIVQEWVAITPDAYRGLLYFLRGLKDKVPLIIWSTDASDPFPHLLQQQERVLPQGMERNLQGFYHRLGELGSGFMWRLVHLPTALTLRPIQPGASFRLKLCVEDAILGNQTLTVETYGDRLVLTDKPALATAKLTVEALTILYSGIRSWSDLIWTGEVGWSGDPGLVVQCDRAWRAPTPFCWDLF
ncbi:MAG: GNAT family N-acetyltransferase [Synechococcales bacterium]|nr:GNAT family N-acetyltransferase [Synechococcales bacterium]